MSETEARKGRTRQRTHVGGSASEGALPGPTESLPLWRHFRRHLELWGWRWHCRRGEARSSACPPRARWAPSGRPGPPAGRACRGLRQPGRADPLSPEGGQAVRRLKHTDTNFQSPRAWVQRPLALGSRHHFCATWCASGRRRVRRERAGAGAPSPPQARARADPGVDPWGHSGNSPAGGAPGAGGHEREACAPARPEFI